MTSKSRLLAGCYVWQYVTCHVQLTIKNHSITDDGYNTEKAWTNILSKLLKQITLITKKILLWTTQKNWTKRVQCIINLSSPSNNLNTKVALLNWLYRALHYIKISIFFPWNVSSTVQSKSIFWSGGAMGR